MAAQLSNFSITNLDKFNVTKLEFQPLKLFFEVEFNFPKLVIDSMYDASAKLMNFNTRSSSGNIQLIAKGKQFLYNVFNFFSVISDIPRIGFKV